MSVAFLTMVWRDHWLLRRWVAHHGGVSGRRALTVLNHGGDPEIDEISQGCNVIHIPRDAPGVDLTRRRWDLIERIAGGLLAFHSRVVCLDVDEFVVHPAGQAALCAHLAELPVGASIAPVGLNLMPVAAKGTDADTPLLLRYPHALLSARYTKPCITALPQHYTEGGHGLVGADFSVDPGLILLHLHYVTPDYVARMADRSALSAAAQSENAARDDPLGRGAGHWRNWRDPGRVRARELAQFAAAVPLDLRHGFQEAAAILNAARIRRGRKRLIAPRALADAPRSVQLPRRVQEML